MRMGVIVNHTASEKHDFTTTQLAFSAASRGHELWYVDLDGFSYQPDEHLCAAGRRAQYRPGQNDAAFLRVIKERRCERIDLCALDVVLLRNNPSEEPPQRAWARQVGFVFGEAVKDRGVVVLNDPEGLSHALSKLYLQHLPERLRPSSLVTRDVAAIIDFVAQRGPTVLKPLHGYGGKAVFLVRDHREPNLRSIAEAVREHGYVIAQEYLPAAQHGDVRLFLVNGEPLRVNGRYAAILRRPTNGDFRGNVTAGAEVLAAEVTPEMLEVAALVRPKLIEDGMFLVGLDIAGDKVMEVNVFSPGGLYGASRLWGVDFPGAVIDALERKLAAVERYRPHHFDNRVIATM